VGLMQIFILDYDINKNVEYYADKHIVKILTEICQILSTVARLNKVYHSDLYKITHENHPCTKWCSESINNFVYCLDLANAIYNEYQYRYNKPEKHQKALQIIQYLKNNYPDLPKKGLTQFTQAIPDIYKQIDTVKAYREYYKQEKQHLFKWTNRQKPDWI
jgi:hypothetical protein